MVTVIALSLLGSVGPQSSAAADAPSFAFDFGPGAVAEEHTAVDCGTDYDPELGYGFMSTDGLDGRDREASDPLHSDFCLGESIDFGVDVPDGSYTVRVVFGDESATQARATATLQGETVISDVGAGAGEYVDRTFDTHVTDGRLSLQLTSSPARINALIITPFEWEPGLDVIDEGSSVLLKNSHVSLRVAKNTAEITALYRNGENPTLNYLRNGSGSYLANWSIDGEAKEQTVRSADFEVVQQDSERIEVVFTEDDPEILPFVLEIHLVLDKDSEGLYYYTVYRYTDDMPDDLTIQQLRYAFRTDSDLFTTYAIDEQRQGVAPLEADFAPEEVQDATYLLPDGSIYSKYQQITDDEGSNSVFGVYGDGVGLSLIQPNKDWMPGGPTRQAITTHTVAEGQILLWHENARHYGATDIEPEPGWEKVYGPFFLYVQDGESDSEMWADAQSQLSEEVEKWPYNWISDPLYAAETRSDVTGTLELTGDETATDSPWVILADPGEHWQSANGSYLYSGRADADGTFTIPAVRPGTYTLYAFVDGVPGELVKEDVVIQPSTTVELGSVEWNTSSPGDLLWRIGEPDRSAGEFAVPQGIESPVVGLEPWREYGTWLQYPVDFPDDANFHVGVDDPATDWPYFQPMMKTPGNLDELKVPYDDSPTSRDISFELDSTPNTDATLTLGIASSVHASLAVGVNGTRVASWDEVPGPSVDNALYRHSDRGQFRQLEAEIPADALEKGENVITLSPATEPGGSDWTSVYANVMYDFVQLSTDAESSLDVELSASTRSLLGNAYVTVTASNRESFPVDIEISTPYGNKTFTDVEPGEQASTSINSTLTSMPEGSATVTVTALVDGDPITVFRTVDYDAQD